MSGATASEDHCLSATLNFVEIAADAVPAERSADRKPNRGCRDHPQRLRLRSEGQPQRSSTRSTRFDHHRRPGVRYCEALLPQCCFKLGARELSCPGQWRSGLAVEIDVGFEIGLMHAGPDFLTRSQSSTTILVIVSGSRRSFVPEHLAT